MNLHEYRKRQSAIIARDALLSDATADLMSMLIDESSVLTVEEEIAVALMEIGVTPRSQCVPEWDVCPEHNDFEDMDVIQTFNDRYDDSDE